MRRLGFAFVLLLVANVSSAAFGETLVYTVSSLEFSPIYDNPAGVVSYPGLYRRIPGSEATFLVAPVHLPDGALVRGVELEYCNYATQPGGGELGATLVEVCRDSSRAPCWPGPDVGEGLSTAGTDPNTCGNRFASFRTFVSAVDNQAKDYHFIVNVAGCDGCVGFRSIRIYYVMSPAPAPNLATFSDVPTTHPFFRFVEALHAAGGTAGCGDGKFCPNAPVTRGQLAVILAATFGLGW